VNSLRVLMVDSERSWRGGQQQVLLLMRGLVEEGVEVHLAAPADGELFRRSADVDVTRHAWEPRGLTAVLRLRQLLTRVRPPLVHSHASRAHGLVALARVGLSPRPVHVVSRRVDFAVGTGVASRWKYRRGADAYIAISEGVRAVLVNGGVSAERVAVARSGVDVEALARTPDASGLRAEFNVRAGEQIVGNIAALAPHKAQNDLLRAAAIVLAKRSDVRLFIVGDGELRDALRGLARELHIDQRVVFTGFREDARTFLRLFDVFVMSSYLEGLGTSILDAQVLGVPVVATRTGGIPEVVEDGVNGLLVPPRSPDELAAALLRMLDDPALRARCAAEASRRAPGYDYRTTVYKTLDVYRRLCDGHPPLAKERKA